MVTKKAISRHKPRGDLSFCPDSEECGRIGHYWGVEFGEVCECCGQVVGDSEELTTDEGSS